MIPSYSVSTFYSVGDRFIYGNNECEAVKDIQAGEQLVIFDPKTEKGNYKLVR